MWRERTTIRDWLEGAEALALALLVHVLIGALLFVGMRWSFERQPVSGAVIQAEVVDVSALVERMDRQRQEAAEAERREREQAEQARLERERREADARAAEQRREQEAAARERQQEQARQRELERQREVQQQREAELEDLRRQQEEQRRRAEEAQRQLEAMEERRRQEEAERQRQAEAQRQRELLEQDRAGRAEAAQASKSAEWQNAIKAVVTRSWIRPPTARAGLSCTVSVRVIPGGEVISASIVEPCNADDATRRSIINAVHGASPLPYRGYEDVFQRSFNFVFRYDG